MTKHDIENCNDVEKLKKLCLSQHSILFCIGETCTSESKKDISSEYAVDKIRRYLNRQENNLEGL